MYLAFEESTDKSKWGTVKDLNDRLEFPGNKGFARPDGDRSNWPLVQAKVVNTSDAGHELENLNDVLYFKPVVAAPFFMTAQQFNTRMDADEKDNDKNFKFSLACYNG